MYNCFITLNFVLLLFLSSAGGIELVIANINEIRSIVAPIIHKAAIVAFIVPAMRLQCRIKIITRNSIFFPMSTTLASIIILILSIISIKRTNLVTIVDVESRGAAQFLIEMESAIRMNTYSFDILSQNIIINHARYVVFDPHRAQSPKTNINGVLIINGNNVTCLISNDLMAPKSDRMKIINVKNDIAFTTNIAKTKTWYFMFCFECF